MSVSAADTRSLLKAAGLPAEELSRWSTAEPCFPEAAAATMRALGHDARAAARYYAQGEALLRRLPAKPLRDAHAEAAAEALNGELAAS